METQIILEIEEDILRGQIAKTAMDLILNFENSEINLKNIEQFEKDCLDQNFYNCCEAITRAKKSIKIIFA
jgi:hypothetical protein